MLVKTGRTVYCCLPTNWQCQTPTVMDESVRERSTALNSWYSPAYQVSTANLTLLPNDAPAFRPYIAQSVQGHWNQTGVSLIPQPKSQDYESNPSKCTIVDFTIRVINPERKREAKTFILKGIELETFGTVKNLREEILEQLGRNVVSFMLDFGVGYMAGNQRICFREKDQIGPQLLRLAKNGSQLWCEGLNHIL